MEIVQEKQTRRLDPIASLTLQEYDMHDPALGGGVAHLKGRYPEDGFVMNEKTKELVYILSGNGKLVTPHEEFPVSKGDLVLVDHGEIYAWDGNMSLFMANAPTFNPEQHKRVPPAE